MKDNEIIKALECCADEDAPCSECPIGRDYDCRLKLAIRSLEIINRQKAEIENLKKGCDVYRQTASDNERMHLDVMWELTEKARAEAIKEFAERLKNVINEDLQSGCDCADYLTDDLPVFIDNLVKEMTEDTQ